MKSISVVIPLYNRADLIAETLQSIERQQLPPTEVILVDDHSTDDSVKAVEGFSRNSALNIKLMSNQRRKGVSGATNTGIAAARGQWIAFLDSDDLWTAGHLQTLATQLDLHPSVDIAFSAVEFFGDAKDLQHNQDAFRASVARALNDGFDPVDPACWVSNGRLLSTVLQHGFPFRIPASVMRKSVFLDKQLGFDEEISYTQDSQFATVAAHRVKFLYSPVLGLRIRRHRENDGDISYGNKIAASFEHRAHALSRHFRDIPLSQEERRALQVRLWSLLSDTMWLRSKGRPWGARALQSLALIRRLPSLPSLKEGIKNLLPR